MKKSTTIIMAMVCTLAYAQAPLTPEITTWITAGSSANFHDAIYSNVQQVQYTEGDVFISCNGIPTYDVGPWDDPALGTNQNFVFRITRSPQPAAENVPVELGRIGVWSNGLSIYNLRNGVSFRADDIWHLDAVRANSETETSCTGLAAENGEYFTRTAPACLYDPITAKEHAPIIGYAFDGYPIYGGYGFVNADGTGGVTRMRSSYQFRDMTERTTLPDGTQLPEVLHGPEVSASYPLGHYVEDYIYMAGSGDLDEHNGRFCVTPEYPNGTYAYFATVDAQGKAQYPYVIGDLYYGEVQEGNIGEFSGHNTIDQSATTYTSAGGNAGIEIMLYPNPTPDYFHVYINPSYQNNLTATLTDISGKLVFVEHNWQPGMNYPIDARTLNSGMYILQLTGGSDSIIEKCIVRH